MTEAFPPIATDDVFQPPIQCQHRNACLSRHGVAKARKQEIDALVVKLDLANTARDEMANRMAVSSQAAEVRRMQERIHALQKVDLEQRRTIDALEETCSRLRTIMRTNKMDMEAVDAIVEDALGRRQKLLPPDAGPEDFGEPSRNPWQITP